MHTLETRTDTHPFSSCLPISILHDPCKTWTKLHAYPSGHPREGSPKGDSCTFCGNVERTAEVVGVRRAVSAKTLRLLLRQGGSAPLPAQPAPRHALLTGLGLLSSSLLPG